MNKKLFDKETFAFLVQKAKGGRTINQYAKETEVSAAHISRLIRQMIDSPPTPKTISKFAQKAYNGITYKELMVAAGYIEQESIAGKNSPIDRKIKMEKLENKYLQVIFSYLYEQPFKWSFEKPEGRGFPHMTINIEHEGYARWYFSFMVASTVFQQYGQVATMKLSQSDKFSIVVDNEREFALLLKSPPKSLRANLYAMLVDLGKGTVEKEELLGEYNG